MYVFDGSRHWQFHLNTIPFILQMVHKDFQVKLGTSLALQYI